MTKTIKSLAALASTALYQEVAAAAKQRRVAAIKTEVYTSEEACIPQPKEGRIICGKPILRTKPVKTTFPSEVQQKLNSMRLDEKAYIQFVTGQNKPEITIKYPEERITRSNFPYSLTWVAQVYGVAKK